MTDGFRLPAQDGRSPAERLSDIAAQLLNERKFDAATIFCQRALALEPNLGCALGNMGAALWNLGSATAAESLTRRALQIEPREAGHYANLGLALRSQRRLGEAEAAFNESIRLAKHKGDKRAVSGATWNRALLRLEHGRWEDGLADYEARVDLYGPTDYAPFHGAVWQGESLDGKTLFVHVEQGVGDRVLFMRWMPELKRRWPTARVLTCLSDDHRDLFWGYRDCFESLPARIPWPDDVDFETRLPSLMRVLGARPDSIIPDPGYVLARAQARGRFRVPAPLSAIGKPLKVGVAWTGNPNQANNVERTLPLDRLIRLAAIPNVFLYSLVVGEGSEEITRIGADGLIFDMSDALSAAGWSATASAILDVDLVITACTSTAHLAGALGVPTILVLWRDPYWVWLQDGSERPRTAFYPSVRIIRQREAGDWDDALSEVAEIVSLASRDGADVVLAA